MPIDQEKRNQLDTQHIYQSITYLPQQIEQAIADIEKLEFPQSYKNCDNIAISGMGASIYPYWAIFSLFAGELDEPLAFINGYQLPKSISKNTFFIGSSYSGSTEETVLTTEKAIEMGANVTALTQGGELADLMNSKQLPFYKFVPRFNPSNQPRIGLGYTIFGVMLILKKLGYLNIDVSSLKKSLEKLQDLDQKLQNKAREIVEKIKNQSIVLITAEHLQGNAHIARNQLNETAKSAAEYHLIPELNHHFMEGLVFPKDNRLIFLFYNSPFFYKRNQQRIAITKQVLKNQSFEFIDINMEAENKLEEFLLFLQLNSYLSFFLGIEHGVDPSKIPYVDYLKKELNSI